MKQSLIDLQNDNEKCLINLTQKYTAEIDNNTHLTIELNQLKKLLVQTEKNNAAMRNDKTIMTDIFLQTQCLPKIVEDPKNSTSSSDTESCVHISLDSAEQLPSRNNCGGPIISSKYLNVDGVLNSADNCFLASDPSETMDKALSKAHVTSSKIFEILAEYENDNSIADGDIDDCPPEFKFSSLMNPSLNENESDSSRNNHEKHLKTEQKKRITLEEIIVDDGIKCFVYQDDDNSEGFLIQAKELMQIS